MSAGVLLWLALAVKPDAGLNSQLEQIARTIQGRVGISATLIETGQSASIHAGSRFPLESVAKFPIAMAILHDVDHRDLTWEEMIRVLPGDLVPPGLHSPLRDRYPRGTTISIRQLLEYAIQQSDGTASDVLLRLAGGPARVTAYARGLGAGSFMIAESENATGRSDAAGYRNWVTPNAAVGLLQALQEGRDLSAESRAFLLNLMSTSATSTHRILGQLPPGTFVAHKTGTSGTSHGLTRGTNDVGLVTLPDNRHLAIAVFLSDSRADEAAREGMIAAITKAVWDHWTLVTHLE